MKGYLPYLHSFSHAHRIRPNPVLSTLSTLQFSRPISSFELLNDPIQPYLPYLHSFSHAHITWTLPVLSTLSTLQFSRPILSFELLNEGLSTLSTLIFTCPQNQTLWSPIYQDPFWYPWELSNMKALGKVVAVNPWKVREECTARRKRVTGCLIQQTIHWQFNSWF